MAYTTVEIVQEYLTSVGVVSSEIDRFIDWTDNYINLKTNMIWSSSTVSSEIIDFDGGNEIYLRKTPLIAVSSIEENTGTDFDMTFEEIASSDYYIGNENSGLVRTRYSYSAGNRKLRLTYDYGYTTTPDIVVELATRLVARQVINKALNENSASSNSGIRIGSIQISNAQSNSYGYLQSTLNKEIEDLFDTLGKLRIYQERR